MTTPCPICNAPYGFHEDEIHSIAYGQVKLYVEVVLESNTVIKKRKGEEKHLAYLQYLESKNV